MDPAAHTLVGAVLAECGLKKVSRYATVTLLIGANLPDIDGIAKFWGQDASLYFRRGWSHGIIAMIILPLLLYGCIHLWHHWQRTRVQNALPFHPVWILALAYLSLLTHPLLDWMNTYGVRLLMPFDQRWFYGDTLFIIDPWIWLMLAAGILLARKSHRVELIVWGVLAAMSSLLILHTDIIPDAVKIIWLLGISLIAGFRYYLRNKKANNRFAHAGLGLTIVYICTVFGVARVTENAIAGKYAPPLQSQVNPLPGQPFTHRSILVYRDHYLVVDAHGCRSRVGRQEPDAIVQAAMQAESIRGFISWTRFPYWEVNRSDNGWLVQFWDLRYQGPGTRRKTSIGYAEVVVPYAGVLHN
jgi:inner membrane protein